MKSLMFRGKTGSMYRLVLGQRALKQILRAAWIGGATYLICWGANGLWGWLSDKRVWVALTVIVMLFNILMIFIHRASYQQFLWNLDRKFDLKEQLTTAAELSKQANEGLAKELLEDSMAAIPKVRRRIANRGWRVREEMEAAVVIVILLLLVYLAGINPITTMIPGGGFGFLPGLGSDPSAEDIFPSKIPGVSPGEAASLGIGEGEGTEGGLGEGVGETSLTSSELGDIGEVMTDLGRSLSEEAATSELGEALERGDFEEAADELESLAEEIEDLSEETKQELADKLEEAAEQLDQPGEQDLAESLIEAAEALREGDDTKAAEKLDDLADELRTLDDIIKDEAVAEGGGDVGSGESETGGYESIERIEGEGETIVLDEGSEETSDYLQSSPGDSGTSEETSDEAYDYIGPSDGTVIEGIIDPLILPWTKLDVVSEYFSP